MNKNCKEVEKDVTSNEPIDPKATKSEELPSRGKERKKTSKKKLLRSANRRRLSGGADDPEGPEDNTAATDGTAGPALNDTSMEGPEDNVTSGGPADHHATASSRSAMEGPEDNVTQEEGPVDLHPGRPLATTGDARVDEMLDCALQNLAEAGKALASLGENLEHELKLFLVELMGRTRKWTSQVESKIEWSRKDILNLHRELARCTAALAESRRESSVLRDQLSSSEAAKSIAQRSLTESLRNGQMFDKTGQLLVMSGLHQGDPSVGQVGNHQSMAPSQVRSVQLGGASLVHSVAAALTSPRSQSRSHLMSSKSPDGMNPTDLPTIHTEEEQLQMCCAELEAEVQELRKENERIVKERAEYENAIQRALLKGVSSLNVEALKVLRCTPIPNCCPPCPPSTTIEPIAKPRECSTPLSSGGTKSPNGNNNQCNNGRSATASNACRSRNGSREALNNNGSGGGRRPCPSASHHQERKQRKSRDNNMLLLLHQKDAENYGIQTGSNCYDNTAKKSTACSGGNCGKFSKSSYMC